MKLDSLGDHLEVVADELPDAQRWAKARSRAERVLGVHSLPDNPSAVGLARLGGGVRVALQSLDGPAGRSVRALERLVALVPDEEPARLRTARAAETLTVALGRLDVIHTDGLLQIRVLQGAVNFYVNSA